jgi:hypothetical protein
MTVETLRDALRAGWQANVYCLGRLRDKPKDRRHCPFRADLDMQTLCLTKGPNFPIADLGMRLMCPRCNGRAFAIMYQQPGEGGRLRA